VLSNRDFFQLRDCQKVSRIRRICFAGIYIGQIGSGEFYLDDLEVETSGGVGGAAARTSAYQPSADTPLSAIPTPTVTPAAVATTTVLMAYPNPARGKVNIVWPDADIQRARVEIYNLLSERIATVSADTANAHGVSWLTDRVSPGIYYYRVILTIHGVEQRREIRKIAIVKQ